MILLSGCASGPQVVTQTETVRVTPPMTLLEPIDEPGPLVLPDDATVEDMISWYEQWVADLQRAFRSAEADKQAVREWVEEKQ